MCLVASQAGLSGAAPVVFSFTFSSPSVSRPLCPPHHPHLDPNAPLALNEQSFLSGAGTHSLHRVILHCCKPWSNFSFSLPFY